MSISKKEKIKTFLTNNKNIIFVIKTILTISIIFVFIMLKPKKDNEINKFIIAMKEDAKGLDPTNEEHTNLYYSNIILDLLHSNFFIKNEKTNEYIPQLLQTIPIKNGKKLMCELKDDVFFHNDTKITSDDVVYTFNRAHEKEHKEYKKIKKVKKINDKKFELELTDDNECWQDPFVKSIRIISQKEMTQNPENGYIIGSGTYKLKKYLPGEKFELEPFQKYNNKKDRKNIEIKISQDDNTLIQELQNNKIHAILDYKSEKIKDLKKNIEEGTFDNIKILENYKANQSYIYFNKRKTKKEVREIISKSLDINKFINDLNLPSEISNAALHNKLIGYDPHIDYHKDLFNREEAKTKVSELSSSEDKKLIIPFNENSPKIQHKIIQELEHIGFKVNKPVDNFEIIISKAGKNDSPYSFIFLGEQFETKFGHKYFEDYFLTSNKTENNFIGIDEQDKPFLEDKINEAKRQTRNMNEYKRLISEIEQYLNQNYYLLPLMKSKTYIITNKKIKKGFEADIFGKYYNMDSIEIE